MMKKTLGMLLAAVMFVGNISGTVLAQDDEPNLEPAFNASEAAEKGLYVDKPLTESTFQERLRQGYRFADQFMVRAGTVDIGLNGYKTTSKSTTVYSTADKTTAIGTIDYRERIYVYSINYTKNVMCIQFKNANKVLTTGYIPYVTGEIYIPDYDWVRPIREGQVTQHYMETLTDPKGHTGIDVGSGVTTSTPLYAVNNGTVTYYYTYGENVAGDLVYTNYGKYAVLKTDADGINAYCIYGHMSDYAEDFDTPNLGSAGTQNIPDTGKETLGSYRVSTGQKLGYVGSTGRSTGNHLHFEVRTTYDGGYGRTTIKDPFTYIIFPDVNWGKN